MKSGRPLVRCVNENRLLRRERCTSKMELSLTISMTVIIRVKRSSKYSDICMVHREEGIGRLRGLSYRTKNKELRSFTID